MAEIPELMKHTISEFSFFAGRGFELSRREVLSPSNYRGGFRLEYRCGARCVTVTYTDLEFSVREGDREIFGPSEHTGFAGNMFSREHLVEHLQAIATSVNQGLS